MCSREIALLITFTLTITLTNRACQSERFSSNASNGGKHQKCIEFASKVHRMWPKESQLCQATLRTQLPCDERRRHRHQLGRGATHPDRRSHNCSMSPADVAWELLRALRLRCPHSAWLFFQLCAGRSDRGHLLLT